jgi:hypothetical protein
VEKEARDPHF